MNPRQAAGRVAAVLLTLSMGAALVGIGYKSGIAIGPDRSLLAVFICLTVAAGLGLVLVNYRGRS